jgi:hypothetical protein
MFAWPTRADVLPLPSKLAARVLVATSVVLCGLFAIERPLGAYLAPLFRSEIELIAPQFTVLSSYTMAAGEKQQLRFRVYLSKAINLDGHVLSPFPDPEANSQAAVEVAFPLSDVFKYGPLTLILVLAWPVAGPKELAVRIALAVPLTTILVLVDIPSAVLANLWNDVRNELGAHSASGWVLFRRCLSGGGGLVLGCFMAGVAIAVGRRLTMKSGTSALWSTSNVLDQAAAELNHRFQLPLRRSHIARRPHHSISQCRSAVPRFIRSHLAGIRSTMVNLGSSRQAGDGHSTKQQG